MYDKIYYIDKEEVDMQSGQGILNNRFGITNIDELQQLEEESVSKRLVELQLKPIEVKFNVKHLQGIHNYLFKDVYPWAGEFRDGGYLRKNRVLSNGQSHIVEYGYSDYLEHNLNKELDKLKANHFFSKCSNKEDFCDKLANLYKELDFLHPFAEGNSRTLREFTRQLGVNAKYNIKWEKTLTIKDDLYIARDLGVNNADASKLIAILNNIVEPLLEPIKIKKKDMDNGR